MLHHNLEQDAEEYFRQLYNEYPLALKAYETILTSLSTLIKNNDYDNISCLIEYIEQGGRSLRLHLYRIDTPFAKNPLYTTNRK